MRISPPKYQVKTGSHETAPRTLSSHTSLLENQSNRGLPLYKVHSLSRGEISYTERDRNRSSMGDSRRP